VRQALGKTWLTFEFDVPALPGVVGEADLDFLTLRRALITRSRQLRRRPSRREMQQLIIAWVNELRAEYEAVELTYDFEGFIDVDLEAERMTLRDF
jgi:hypothetical protein